MSSVLPLVASAFVSCTLVSCTGASRDASIAPVGTPSAVTPDLVARAWQVRLAKDEARAPFEGRASWIAYFGGRRDEALRAFAAENDAAALARTHAEYAAVYRQAARMAAEATIQVYGKDAQPTDPAECAYLLGVSGALLARDDWAGKLGLSAKSAVPGIAARDAAWEGWVAGGAAWPPDEAAGASAPPVAPGTLPAPSEGTYGLPEQGAPGTVDAGDPGAMWALSRWHERAALVADATQADAVARLLDPWRLGAEPKGAPGTAPWNDTFLFMSPYTSAEDGAFLSDLARDGVAAVERHATESAYAAVARHCTKEGALIVDCVLDEAAALGKAIESGMAAAAGGEQSFHRAFADYARVGVLRAGDRVAEAMGDRESSGRLRINAFDRSGGDRLDPLFLAFVAAWDAGNRNTVRAEEIVHDILPQVPGLDVARRPLDALHVRLSRNAAPGLPMH